MLEQTPVLIPQEGIFFIPQIQAAFYFTKEIIKIFTKIVSVNKINVLALVLNLYLHRLKQIQLKNKRHEQRRQIKGTKTYNGQNR